MSSTHSCRRSILLKMVKYSGEIAVLSFYVGVSSFFSLYFKGLEPGGRLRGRGAEESKKNMGKTKQKIWQRDECSGAVVDGARCWAGLGGTVWHTALCRGKEEAQVLTITDTSAFLKKIYIYFLKSPFNNVPCDAGDVCARAWGGMSVEFNWGWMDSSERTGQRKHD